MLIKKNNFIGLKLNNRTILNRQFSLEILFIYRYEIKELIDSFKFYRNLKSGKLLVKEVLSVMDLNLIKEIDCIVPSPSHFIENTIRGYETMSYLCKLISDVLKIPNKSILRKKFFPLFNRTQKKKTKKQRILRFGMFYLEKKAQILGKNILLVDDVWTTGTTTRALVDLLYYNGAKNVQVLVFSLA